MDDDMFARLAAPFPKEKIHWRAQSVAQNGDNAGKSAMALAYLDARDVMNRLDEVCGPDGWQCEHYDVGGGKLACKIGICFGGGVWVWKSDGAGETQVEAEKGAFSGALKRAAVAWGIGRYLYDLPAPWVPCECYKSQQGKWMFKKWKANPWSYCTKDLSPHEDEKTPPPRAEPTKGIEGLPKNEQEWKAWGKDIVAKMNGASGKGALKMIWSEASDTFNACPSQRLKDALQDTYDGRMQIFDTPNKDELSELDAG